MDDQHSVNLLNVFVDIFATSFRLISEMTELAKLEAKLAGKSLAKIIAISFVIGTFLTATWLCICALIIYYLHLQYSWPIALITVIFFNVGVLVLLLYLILKAKDKLFFPAFRRQLSSESQRMKEGAVNEQA